MRGRTNDRVAVFSYVDLEARVRRDHPLRSIREIVNEALVPLERRVRRALFQRWAAVRSAGEAAASDAAAGVLRASARNGS